MEMDYVNMKAFEACILQLDEHAKPSKNDKRFEAYVSYINCFISKFGNEKVYLVGSTGERSKLAFCKDDGDADFLLVSGRLEVSVSDLDVKDSNPCYVWIRADDISRQIGLDIVENIYLSAHSLREVKPELFTLLRAIHSQFTASMDRLPETDQDLTTISVSSKVGLAKTKYRSLKFDRCITESRRRQPRRVVCSRSVDTRRRLIERWRCFQMQEHDRNMFRRIYKVLKLALQPAGKSANNGGISAFVQFVEDALKRPKLDTDSQNETCSQLHHKGSDLHSTTPINTAGNDDKKDLYQNDLGNENVHHENDGVRATYSEKDHKDFVPALVLVGDIDVMKQWKERVESCGWPVSKINDIYTTDVFVVARVSPINPNIDKDFCLSFNLAEQKLVKWMSSVQRNVLLVLKAFLKGIFERKHKQYGHEMKLKTYHVKTVLFWICELNDNVFEANDTEAVYIVLEIALDYIHEKLVERNLSHYFVPSDLFSNFEDIDFTILKECVVEAKLDPVGCLNYYFGLNDGKRGEVWFTQEEMNCLLEMSTDGGRSNHVDKLEDAMIDLQRGLIDSQSGSEYRSELIKEAIIDTIRLVLDDGSRVHAVDYSLFKHINTFLTSDETDLSKISPSEANQKVTAATDLVVGLSHIIPKVMHFFDKFGGTPGLQSVLHGAFCGKAVDFSIDVEQQIIETVDRCFSCTNEEEDNLVSELKYKLAGYFLCMVEFPDMSGIRVV